jgi:alpha-ribazole phosphatase
LQNTLYLLRHGELEQKHVLAGHSDLLLSSVGEQQLVEKVKELPQINQLFSSPLARCYIFAQLFAKQQRLTLQTSALLKEMNFGDWDGLPFETLWQTTSTEQSRLGDFWQNPWQHTPPNGETMAEFTQRVDCWWQTWLTQKPAGNSLAITHAGVIKHLLARVVGLDIKQSQHLSVFDIPYAGLIRIDVFHEEQQAWPKIIF